MSRWVVPGSRKARTGRRAAAFQRWYTHLADARAGRANLSALRADVDSAAAGPAQALRSYQAMRPYLAFNDSSLRATVRRLVRRMDSRAEHRATFATIAGRDLAALSLAERVLTNAKTGRGCYAEAALVPFIAPAALPVYRLGLRRTATWKGRQYR